VSQYHTLFPIIWHFLQSSSVQKRCVGVRHETALLPFKRSSSALFSAIVRILLHCDSILEKKSKGIRSLTCTSGRIRTLHCNGKIIYVLVRIPCLNLNLFSYCSAVVLLPFRYSCVLDTFYRSYFWRVLMIWRVS
jgi:hypothetical protein